MMDIWFLILIKYIIFGEIVVIYIGFGGIIMVDYDDVIYCVYVCF